MSLQLSYSCIKMGEWFICGLFLLGVVYLGQSSLDVKEQDELSLNRKFSDISTAAMY